MKQNAKTRGFGTFGGKHTESPICGKKCQQPQTCQPLWYLANIRGCTKKASNKHNPWNLAKMTRKLPKHQNRSFGFDHLVTLQAAKYPSSANMTLSNHRDPGLGPLVKTFGKPRKMSSANNKKHHYPWQKMRKTKNLTHGTSRVFYHKNSSKKHSAKRHNYPCTGKSLRSQSRL